MSLWSRINAPTWFRDAIVSKVGWLNRVTREILVAIRGMDKKREQDIDNQEPLLLCEDGTPLVLEQDLSHDDGEDFIQIE